MWQTCVSRWFILPTHQLRFGVTHEMLKNLVDNAVLEARWSNESVANEELEYACTIRNIAQGSLASALGLEIGDLLVLSNGARLKCRWQLNDWPDQGEMDYQFYRPSNKESLIAKTALMPLGIELGYLADLALSVAKDARFKYKDVVPLWCDKEWDALDKIAKVLAPQSIKELFFLFVGVIFKRSAGHWDPELSTFISGCAEFELGRLDASKKAFVEYYEDSFYSYPSDFAALYYYYQAKIAQQEWRTADAKHFIEEAFLQIDSVVYRKSILTIAIVGLYKEIHRSEPLSEVKSRLGEVLSWDGPLNALDRDKMLERTWTLDKFIRNLEDEQRLLICCMSSKRVAPIYANFLREFEIYWHSFNLVIPHLLVITDTLETDNTHALDVETNLLHRHPNSLTVLYDKSGSLIEDWEIHSYPYIIMIDKNAQVIHEGLPSDDHHWMDMINS